MTWKIVKPADVKRRDHVKFECRSRYRGVPRILTVVGWVYEINEDSLHVGNELSHTESDTNFEVLNTKKYEFCDIRSIMRDVWY